jgi:hypothetical protein
MNPTHETRHDRVNSKCDGSRLRPGRRPWYWHDPDAYPRDNCIAPDHPQVYLAVFLYVCESLTTSFTLQCFFTVC